MTLMKLLALLALGFSASLARHHSHEHDHHHHQHPTRLAEEMEGPFTDHFHQFLKSNTQYKYASDAFSSYGNTGTFGGKRDSEDNVHHVPIVFIHGNSDSALDFGATDGSNSGWNRQLAYLTGRGYTFSEMYGLTYGDRLLANSFIRTINCDDLMGLRKFVEAVLEYTGSNKINIIGHSMGVTYARALIHGGEYTLVGRTCDIGSDLSDRIETLIAISSANYGMCICGGFHSFPACNDATGYYPGNCSTNAACASEETCDKFTDGYSNILQQLNSHGKDAKHVFSLWSSGDQIIGAGKNMVFGRQTSLVPNSDINVRFSGLTHFEMKTETVSQQYYLLKHHKLPKSMYNPESEEDD